MENGKENPLQIPTSPVNGQPIPLNGGRPKGVPNKATTQFKEALNGLFEYAAPEMVNWLKEIEDPEKRFDILAKFAQYLYPKLANTDLNVGGQKDNPLKMILESIDGRSADLPEDKE